MEKYVRVTIDIAEPFTDALSLTCIGTENGVGNTVTHVCTRAVRLEDGCSLVVENNGEVKQFKTEETRE